MASEHAGRRQPIHHLTATYLPDERWDPELVGALRGARPE
jgi:hypothetical protein